MIFKQKIADLLTAYHYDLGETKNNYLFVIDENGETVRNPAFPELNGQNILNIKDATGNYFIHDFMHILQQKSEGFVKYYWAKPEYPHKVSEKLTFVKTFEPFNWVISTGIYLEDIGIQDMQAALEREASQIIWDSILIGLILLLIGSLVSMGLVDILVKPLVQARHVARNIAKGDFSQRINYQSQDEMGQLSKAINSMAYQLQDSFEHLVLLNREKDEFLGIAAHDLKNPLQAIQGSAELIGITVESEQFEDKHAVLEFANMINVSAERMFGLITNLLDVNAIEAGKIKVNLQSVDILPILKEVVEEYTQKSLAKRIDIQFHPDGGEYQAVTDATLLHQILDNLVSNAVKYSPFDKQVFIHITQQTQHIKVEIQDQGEGLSQADQDKLFGKFTRLTTRPTDGEHSTGLGLFIVKKLLHALQGEVWCESELGQGSTFIVTVPIKKPS
ncbi:cache domain-containing protein [Candidatus Albibeggiatoa sp. nov. BB20]|uniref:cache domain-containing protein n=1 Tax=Candidatus Albibeggiatoa sp. nov. BB20 TaxID=3162723 RepID=UPI0033657D96